MIHRRSINLNLFSLLAACALAAGASDSVGVLAVKDQPALAANDSMQWCRVNGDQVNIRVTPDTANLPVTSLRNGAYVRGAMAPQNNWLEIEWPSHVPAWVLKDTIEASADGKSGAVRTVRARIMSQGMTTAPELAMLERGAKVSIVAQKGDWFQVQAPAAARAYINAKYVVIGTEAPGAEIVVLQEEARWPKIIPASHAPAMKAPAVKEESIQLVEVVDLAKILAEKRAAEKRIAEEQHAAEELAAAAERKRVEEEHARMHRKLVLKNNIPIFLSEDDLKNGTEPSESNYVAAGAILVPAPEPATAAKAVESVTTGPAVVEVTDSNFESEVEKHEGPVLIDFYAPWCGPCRMASPLVDEVAEEFRGRVKVAKIDVDQAPSVARRFGINSIPCLMVLDAGKTTHRATGIPGKEMLRAWMQSK